jgi:hypothetical protein
MPRSHGEHLSNPWTARELMGTCFQEGYPEFHGRMPNLGRPTEGEIW